MKSKVDLPENSSKSVLHAKGITTEISEKFLLQVFSQFQGLKDLKLLKGKGEAIVEYNNELNATAAMVGLNGKELTNDCRLELVYASEIN